MSFSAAIGLGLQGLQMAQGASAARSNAAFANANLLRQDLQAQRIEDHNQFMRFRSQDLDRERQENNEFQERLNLLDRGIAQEEYQFRIAEFVAEKEAKLREREFVIDRQIQEDQAAARQRAFMIQQLLNNQQITGDEREFALDEMRNAQRIATTEGTRDRRDFLIERARKEVEREFAQRAYEDNVAQRNRERADEMAVRDRQASEIDSMLASLDMVQDEFLSAGDILDQVEDFSPQRLADVEADLLEESFGDIERAAVLASSGSRAGLIRAGVDDSTVGNAERNRIARDIADRFTAARNTAREGALTLLSGRQKLNEGSIANRLGVRNQLLSQASVPNQAALNELRYLQTLPTATSANWANLPTSAYARTGLSFNDYRAPLNPGSGVYDALTRQTGTGLAGFLNPRSATSSSYTGLGTGIHSPFKPTIPDGNTLLANIGTGLNNVLGNLSGRQSDLNQAASGAARNYGAAQADFFDTAGSKLGSYLDKKYPNFWGSSPTVTAGVSNNMHSPRYWGGSRNFG